MDINALIEIGLVDPGLPITHRCPNPECQEFSSEEAPDRIVWIEDRKLQCDTCGTSGLSEYFNPYTQLEEGSIDQLYKWASAAKAAMEEAKKLRDNLVDVLLKQNDQYQALTQTWDDYTRAFVQIDSALRFEAVNVYEAAAEQDPKTPKRVHPKVGIRGNKVVVYDQEKAQAWAKEKAPMFLVLDKKEFEKYAKQDVQPIPAPAEVKTVNAATVSY